MKNIILLHGALGAQDQLEPLENALSQLDYQVHSFSFSGHGKTAFQNEFGIVQFANELEKFISKHKLQQPSVFAYSMGGYVALYLASQKNSLLGNIITLGTKFGWTKETAQREIKQLDPKVILEKVPKYADALKQRHGDDWELLLERTADMMVSLGNNNILNSDLFSKINNHVLVGLADKDSMVTAEETTIAIDQLYNSERYTLHDTKHPMETVDVAILAAIIDAFLKK
ncbi:MAG: alpha/beta fold hydrolase [Sphingobacteriaceae bacterium]|nr:alpha/beta fold hydrolase [Sphingobacteriaceae bacterium]